MKIVELQDIIGAKLLRVCAHSGTCKYAWVALILIIVISGAH